MSAIGNVIGKAVDAATGSQSGTSLQDFLSQFSSAEGIWAKTIDPYSSFDVSIKFYPNAEKVDTTDNSWKKKLSNAANSLVESAQDATRNLLNNATGGLLGSFMNKIDVMKVHNDRTAAELKNQTFLEYLAAANLIAGKSGWVGENAGQTSTPLILQLGPYCQEITLPNFEIPQGGTSQTSIGEFPINGTIVKPDSNVLTLMIVNTKVPLHERIFYPWMREVVSPMWHYDIQPYTTATITVDMTKHSDCKYVFCGCRPQKINLQQPTQDGTSPNLIRPVSFLFDCMIVTSSLTVAESPTDKLLSTGKTLFNSASKMLNA